MDAVKTRSIICDYLKSNPALIDTMKLSDIAQLEGISFDTYVNSMEQQSTWGGGIEIRAFCNIFNLQVDVNSLPNNKKIEFYPISGNPIGKIDITWNGGHFEPVRHSAKSFVTN